MPLTSWESFYVIVGSSAGELTGLQFVVVVLGTELNVLGSGSGLTTSAFATPTVMHFCAVLLMSAILSAPWPTLTGPAIALGVCGFLGVAYTANVVRKARRQDDYEPVMEDWIFHAILPLVAYAVVLAAAFGLVPQPGRALFAIAAAVITLLFVGIHNAWDAVVYMALRARKPTDT